MSKPEQWRPLPEYPDQYEVSDLGRVRSLPRNPSFGRSFAGRIRRASLDGAGYLGVMLCVDNHRVRRKVHRMVLEAFVGAAPGLVCNHKDGDRTNNTLPNLEWVTQRENLQHARDVLGHRAARGEAVGISKLTPALVVLIRQMSSSGQSQRQIARAITSSGAATISNTAVRDVLSGRTWAHITRAGDT